MDDKMTHGGKRAGAGRPRANIDDKRVLVLRAQGLTFKAIALRFGVEVDAVRYSVKHSLKNSTATAKEKNED